MPTWKTKLLSWFLWYSAEAALATVGFIYGFGLEVKNWPALIGTLFLARFLFHVISSIAYFNQARTAYEQKSEDSAP